MSKLAITAYCQLAMLANFSLYSLPDHLPHLTTLEWSGSIRIDIDTIDYFKRKAEETGIAISIL